MMLFRGTVSRNIILNEVEHMAYTLGEATKATGISKTSLHRAIKSGRISAKKKDDGSYEIDPSELHRVYPAVEQGNSSDNSVLEQTVTPETLVETEVLRREVQLLRERLTDKDEMIGDLKGRLDQSEQERREKDRQLTALLTDQRPKTEVEPPPAAPLEAEPRRKGLRGWLHRITG
jgi:hypothetical protein